MVQYPACTALADANVMIDTNVTSWGECLNQSVGMGDPALMGVLVLIAFGVFLLLGRQNLAVSSMLIFGLSGVYTMINPSPFWLTLTAGIAIVSIVLFIRGIKQHAQ